MACPVSRIDHHHIDAATLQFRQPFVPVFPDADCRPDTQTAQGILAGEGIAPPFLDVLDGDQPLQVEGVVHHQELLDTVLMQQFLRFVQVGALRHGDQAFGRHQGGHWLLQVGHEAQVAVGENSRQLRSLGDGDAGNPVARHHLDGLLHPLVRRHGDRVHDHTAFGTLDLVDLGGLRLDAEILVDDANAALLRQGDGEIGLGDRIHRRAEQRDVEFNVVGQQGRHVGVTRQHVRMGGQQQHIVERQTFGQRFFEHGDLLLGA